MIDPTGQRSRAIAINDMKIMAICHPRRIYGALNHRWYATRRAIEFVKWVGQLHPGMPIVHGHFRTEIGTVRHIRLT